MGSCWYLCADGRGRAAELDRKASGSTAGLRLRFSSAAAGCSRVAGGEETESVRDAAVLEQQVRVGEYLTRALLHHPCNINVMSP